MYYLDTDTACVFDARSCQKATKYLEDDATASADMHATLPYIFALSRFAHFLKKIQRDQVGATWSRQQVEEHLQKWIGQYVLLNDSASLEEKSKKPLRAAKIQVEDVPGKPGWYTAVLRLTPHFQMKGIDVSLRLTLDNPKKE